VRHVAIQVGVALVVGSGVWAPAHAAEVPASPATVANPYCEPDDVKARVERATPQVVGCYERDVDVRRTFAGRLVVTFRIKEGGRVARVKVPSAVQGDAAFRECLAHSLQSVRFAAPVGGECDIRFPFQFDVGRPPPGPALAGTIARVGGVEVVAPGEGPRYAALRNALPVPENPKDHEAQVRLAMARDLIEDELLRQHAAQRGIRVSTAELDAEFTHLRKEFGSDAGADAFAMRVAGGRAELRSALALRRTLDLLYQKNGDLPMSPAQRDALWLAWPGLWARPESAVVDQVFVAVPPDATPGELEAARNDIEVVHRALLLPGADFAALARKYSHSPTAMDGGAMGRIKRGQMPEAFEAAAWSLPLGTVSEPIRSPVGFHILRIHRRDPARTAHIAELEQESPGLLAARHRRQVRAALVRSLSANAVIEPMSDEARQVVPQLGAIPWLVPDALGPDADIWPYTR